MAKNKKAAAREFVMRIFCLARSRYRRQGTKTHVKLGIQQGDKVCRFFILFLALIAVKQKFLLLIEQFCVCVKIGEL